MPAVNASELERLRTDFTAWFVEECLINRPALTSDGRGGQTETVSVAENVPCRRTAPNIGPAGEMTVGGGMQSIIQWVISLPAETDVRPNDRLVIGERTYEVNADLDRTTEIARYVLATEVGS